MSGIGCFISRIRNSRIYTMSNLDELIEAVKLRDVDRVRKILDEHGELVYERDETGATALHYAAFDGFREIV